MYLVRNSAFLLVVAAIGSSAFLYPSMLDTELEYELEYGVVFPHNPEDCVFSGGDSIELLDLIQSFCSTIILSNLAVPAGKTLNLSMLQPNTKVIFEGETTWGYQEWAGPLLQIQGIGITVKGANGAVLNGAGAQYWDGLGSNGGKKKPKFFHAHRLMDSTISNLFIKNTPVHSMSINECEELTISHVTIDNRDGDEAGGHNTDGFDISSSHHILIEDCRVFNQDDCVAINSGTHIFFVNGLCDGGHGISIGSVGGRTDNLVRNVRFANSMVQRSTNGIRLKTNILTTGQIKGVTYENITLQDIRKYGFLVEQNYRNGDLKGEPTDGVPITDLVLRNIDGADSVDAKGYNFVIACARGACADWVWDNVDISGGGLKYDCLNVPDGVSC